MSPQILLIKEIHHQRWKARSSITPVSLPESDCWYYTSFVCACQGVLGENFSTVSRRWGLLTNHALVLIHVTQHPRSTLRDIATAVGITERSALSILRAVEGDALISRRKDGRRIVYTVDIEALLQHRSHGRLTIEQIASALWTLGGREPGGGPLRGAESDGGDRDGPPADE